jgi:anti-anti-sigma factor
MTIESERTDNGVLMYLNGRLDTATAPQLERKIKQWGDEISELVIDFNDLTYISSMGLRVLLQTQKSMKTSGRKLVIKNMNESIREVFEMTGFINLMVQEEKFVVIRKDEGGQIILSLIGDLEPGNIPGLARELSQIKEAGQADDQEYVLVLDAGKLSALAEGTCRLLRHAIEESDWARRKLSIRSLSADLRKEFQKNGMGDLIEEDN